MFSPVFVADTNIIFEIFDLIDYNFAAPLRQLIKAATESIHFEVEIAGTICWADSTIGYYWITQKRKDWKPYGFSII